MKYRTLGSTNLRVSVVGIGTWQFGGEWGKDFEQTEVNAMFQRGLELGINLLDTAECYGHHLSEEFCGAALASGQAGRREDWVVATKFGHHFHGPFDRDVVYDPDKVTQQLEDSLKALRTDYIDLYQFHSGPDEEFDRTELWDTLARFKQQGKVRHLGVSIGGNNVHQTENAKQVGAETIQVIYNRLTQEPEQQILPICQRDHLGVLARVPLASGFLSGKYKPGHRFDENEVRGKWYAKDADERLEKAMEIQKNEVPENVPMAQWALAWCLQHPAVTCVIPGCKTVEQVEGNAAAAELEGLVRDDHPQATA